MPRRKKELLVSFEEIPQPSSPLPQEEAAAPPEVISRPKRKPAASKLKAKPQTEANSEVIADSVVIADSEPLADTSSDTSAIIETPAVSAPEAATSSEVEAIVTDVDDSPAESREVILQEEKIDKKQRKETHTKHPFFIRNDLLERLDSLSKLKGKGFKTNLINYALEKSLDELEVK
ncbi:hypothetical protein [Paenibacillus eucommiae]|uniref:Uncharacterized protein n=1 Tax=Paenibacillus eucommiae TaxID=1355755 RepID=A0ABS4J942_9BACL|nr:hypothetical protein [Paenibacillus eucommiae]MBP1996373.1 hypothetical protein [Paenibacillus eucommiae]